MSRTQLYRLHKWVAISAGGFFLSWMISGIVMIWPGDALKRRPLKPEYRTATVSPAQAAGKVSERVREMALARVGGKLLYQLQTDNGTWLVDAHSGELFLITAEVAENVVRSEYLLPATAHGPAMTPTLRTKRLDRYDREYRAGPLPVYRITADESGPRYYVSAVDGAVRIVTTGGRLRGMIAGMHTFEAVPLINSNTRLRKAALCGAALIGLCAAVTGYVIAFPRRRLSRREPEIVSTVGSE